MAGPAKPKPKAPVKTDAETPKPKPSRKKPAKTLTLEEATEQLVALNLSSLTEEDRLSAIIEIRERLAEQAHTHEPPAQALARRILFLRLWHELVRMRVIDIQSERKPPFAKISAERLFPPASHGGEAAMERAEPEHTAALQEALRPLSVKSIDPPAGPVEEHLVRVKLLESEMVRGMKLPAGISVDVQPEDAEHLIEKGKAVLA